MQTHHTDYAMHYTIIIRILFTKYSTIMTLKMDLVQCYFIFYGRAFYLIFFFSMLFQIMDLAPQFPALKTIRSCDLLRFSWISVAWCDTTTANVFISFYE